MRIALITDGITPYVTGGMQRHSYHLAKNLLKLGVDLTLVHAVPSGEPLPSHQEICALLEANPEKLDVIGLHFPKSGNIPGHYIRESYIYSCQVYESLEGQWRDFDFIYAKGLTAWCLLENRKAGAHTAPIGVKFHGYEMFQKTSDVKGKLIQFMFRPAVVFNNREANVVFSYGGEISEIIKKIGVPEERIINIGSGIDDEWILPAPLPQKGKRRFLFIGRNERRKGISELLKCEDVIKSEDIEFHWIGPIPKQKQMRCPNNFYHGEIKDIERLREIIDTCQVLVAPSHSEGMPNVILEAMSRGLAIVSTRVGAVPMLVSEGNGQLLKPGSVRDLKLAIRRFSVMPNTELFEMRQKSIHKVSMQFRWSAIAQQTMEEIRKVTYSG
jgi:glycosyltransferase involved in cell wall biosynthesis